MRIRSGETVTTIPLHRIAPGFRRAELRFEGLTPPLRSFEVRVFAGEPNANARTPTTGNPHYLGSQFFYGLGVADERSGARASGDARRSGDPSGDRGSVPAG